MSEMTVEYEQLKEPIPNMVLDNNGPKTTCDKCGRSFVSGDVLGFRYRVERRENLFKDNVVYEKRIVTVHLDCLVPGEQTQK